MELDQKTSSTSEISALNTTKDEKQKEDYAADQFFSSLLVTWRKARNESAAAT
jgi:hypothetical protein